tara:strand:+ start:33 stop:668 length:636 start_codon:yes stop_codon:yes gene_type:complete
MSEYGYIPESPDQSFGNNKGIFTPNDIYDLTKADKYTSYGQLELIETQNISGTVAQVDFTSIKQNIYNVHFLTYNNIQIDTDANEMGIRIGDGSSFIAGGYQTAIQEGNSNGTFSETKSTSQTYFRLGGDTGTGTNENANGFVYFYNLGNSSKYSFVTCHCVTWDRNPYAKMVFGSSFFGDTREVTALRCFITTGNFDNGSISLYGVKAYS